MTFLIVSQDLSASNVALPEHAHWRSRPPVGIRFPTPYGTGRSNSILRALVSKCQLNNANTEAESPTIKVAVLQSFITKPSR